MSGEDPKKPPPEIQSEEPERQLPDDQEQQGSVSRENNVRSSPPTRKVEDEGTLNLTGQLVARGSAIDQTEQFFDPKQVPTTTSSPCVGSELARADSSPGSDSSHPKAPTEKFVLEGPPPVQAREDGTVPLPPEELTGEPGWADAGAHQVPHFHPDSRESSNATELTPCVGSQQTHTEVVSQEGGGLTGGANGGVPGYRPLHKLGEGTYGQVWLYEDGKTGVHVAIKFFTHEQGLQWLLLQAEVKQLAMLHADPGIVQLLDVEPDSRPPYYIMTYAEGGSLAQRLEGGKTLPVPLATRIFREVAEALAYVHAKGVRHCDLKPGNVLLDRRDRALLADFGQAHLTTQNAPALGTFFYMAPEQATLDNQLPDARWDVYALGALFHTMVTGSPPREHPGIREELAEARDLKGRLLCYRRCVTEDAPATNHHKVRGVDRSFATIIDRCLEIDPARRFRDAGAVLGALDTRERIRRRRPVVLFGLLGPLALLLILTGMGYWMAHAEIQEAQNHLVDQLQESDRVSAGLVANVVEDHLQERIHHLERFRKAHQKELASRLQKGIDQNDPQLRELVRSLYQPEPHRRLFEQYWLADRAGVVLVGYPAPAGQLKPDRPARRWSFRDWFNGRGDHYEEENKDFDPIKDIHVSQPYVPRFPVKHKELSINISIPIRKHPEVVGVLTGQIKISALHTWLKGVNIKDGFVVLLNDRGHCLLHKDPKRYYPRRTSGRHRQNPVQWNQRCAFYRKILTRAGHQDSAGEGRYQDPIEEEEFLAGYRIFSPCVESPEKRWVAIVQHRTTAILNPVQELKSSLFINCLTALSAGILVVCSLWGWLFFTLRSAQQGG